MNPLSDLSIKADAAEKLKQRAHDAVDAAAEAVPGAVSRLAASADDLARRGIDSARGAANDVRDAALRAGDAAADRIRDDPLKSVLVAAAAGAAATLLVRWLAGRGKAD